MSWYVYILQNPSGRLYKGMAQDSDARLGDHNAGKVKSTKAFVPWKIIYVEEMESRTAAREREKYFKSGAGRRYIKKYILD
ncbi:MAG: GIY-YIG nuclease family protein [Chitinophagales bacterium]